MLLERGEHSPVDREKKEEKWKVRRYSLGEIFLRAFLLW